MIASYRIIHFTPDPFVEARFPLGAVVQDADGLIFVVPAKQIPSADCLGDAQLAFAARRLHARLDTIESCDALPPIFGPYTELGSRFTLPAGVGDVRHWVQTLFPPAKPDAAVQRRGAHRATLGYAVFRERPVARYVRKTFRPTLDGAEWLGPRARHLSEVSHWVKGRDQVLLMEPVVPDRIKHKQDIREIATKFLAYRGLMERAEGCPTQGKLVAYITAHQDIGLRRASIEALAGVSDEVFDTGEPASLDELLVEIERVGSTGTGQAPLLASGEVLVNK